MTQVNVTGASAQRPVLRSTLGNTMTAEWTKIRSVRSTFWTLVLTVVITVGIAAIVTAAVAADDSETEDLVTASLASLQLGQITIVVLGALVITAEYTTGLVRATLAATPNRTRLLTAKVQVFGLVVLVVGLLVSLASYLVGRVIYEANGVDSGAGTGVTVRSILGGGVYLALLGLMSLGVGVLLRATAGTISAMLTVLLVAPILVAFLPSRWGDDIAKFLPGNLGGSLTTPDTSDSTMSAGPALLVLVVYTAAVLLAAYVMLNRRDA